jgi:glycosyltransferase involved in cell wall biosynthesis
MSILSWSMLEAMAAGCAVVGSATAPVEEVIEDGKDGLLADFFNCKAIAEKADLALANNKEIREIRTRARKTIVERYDLQKVCLPKHVALVEGLANGQAPTAIGAAGIRGPRDTSHRPPKTSNVMDVVKRVVRRKH